MIRTIPVIAAFLVVFSSATQIHAGLFSSLSVKEETGNIKGVVLDANEARVANATVQVENAKFKREVKSGVEGNFEIEIPSGLYRIIIKADGFRKFEYSPFSVKANVIEMVNIHLEVEPPKMPVKVQLEPHNTRRTFELNI